MESLAASYGAKRIVASRNGKTECVYASNAQTGNIVGILVKTFTIGGQAFGSKKDKGSSNGVGLAMNTQYLYASFTNSNTIGTFQVKPGCKIKFVGDITVGGLQGGVVGSERNNRDRRSVVCRRIRCAVLHRGNQSEIRRQEVHPRRIFQFARD
jgi:hypothetical protein